MDSTHPRDPGAPAACRAGTGTAAGSGSGIPEPGCVPVPDLLGYLAGAWHVERTVRDAASGMEGTFTGTTVFAPLAPAHLAPAPPAPPPGASGPGQGVSRASHAAGSGIPPTPSLPASAPASGLAPAAGEPATARGLLSRESGTFTWQGTARPAERVLRFLAAERPGTARVEFADGRPFHDLDLTSGHDVAHHPCAADRYRGEFTVLGPDRWRTVWQVAGPAKDQLLVTEYTRRSAPAPDREAAHAPVEGVDGRS